MQNHIENIDAWERGRDAAIRRNASKSRNIKWIAEDESRKEIQAFLFGRYGEDFLSAMNESVNEWGQLTEGQEKAVRKIITAQAERDAERQARKAEENANAADCPEGRTEVTGEIIATDLRETDFGSQWKMLVRDDSGFKVWGSIPSKMFDIFAVDDVWPHGDTFKGKRISFTAAISPSEDDPKFGFFKRPTKTKDVA